MRYRVTFTAKEDQDFYWSASDVIETDDLLSLIFQFQIVIANEFKKIIEMSKQMSVKHDDDSIDEIPF